MPSPRDLDSSKEEWRSWTTVGGRDHEYRHHRFGEHRRHVREALCRSRPRRSREQLAWAGVLTGLVEEIGPRTRAATVEEAAEFGEVVLVAVPFFAHETLPAERLSGKVLVDAMNYYLGRDGTIDFGELSSSEFLAQHLPGARVIKVFNTHVLRDACH
jgi:hypothetical protein